MHFSGHGLLISRVNMHSVARELADQGASLMVARLLVGFFITEDPARIRAEDHALKSQNIFVIFSFVSTICTFHSYSSDLSFPSFVLCFLLVAHYNLWILCTQFFFFFQKLNSSFKKKFFNNLPKLFKLNWSLCWTE